MPVFAKLNFVKKYISHEKFRYEIIMKCQEHFYYSLLVLTLGCTFCNCKVPSSFKLFLLYLVLGWWWPEDGFLLWEVVVVVCNFYLATFVPSLFNLHQILINNPVQLNSL